MKKIPKRRCFHSGINGNARIFEHREISASPSSSVAVIGNERRFIFKKSKELSHSISHWHRRIKNLFVNITLERTLYRTKVKQYVTRNMSHIMCYSMKTNKRGYFVGKYKFHSLPLKSSDIQKYWSCYNTSCQRNSSLFDTVKTLDFF